MASAYVNQDVRVVAARIAGKSAAMDDAAGRIMRAAQAVATQYVDTTAYVNNFQVVTVPGLRGNGRLVDDRLVVNNDDGAAAQEWGYMRRFPNSRRVQYIPGRHILGRGLATVR